MATVGRHKILRGQVAPGSLQTCAGLVQPKTSSVFLEHLQAPAEARGEPQGTILIEPAAIKVVGRLGWRDAKKPFRLFGRSQPLRHALVGETIHANFAIGFRALAQRSDCVEAIVGFMPEGIKASF